ADHHIADSGEFHRVLQDAKTLAEKGHLVLFGIRPAKPETGYGYIQQGAPLDKYGFAVSRFVEKPDLATAQAYVSGGDYLWNSGMFLMSAQLYLTELKALNPDLYDSCMMAFNGAQRDRNLLHIPANSFEHCPNDSID